MNCEHCEESAYVIDKLAKLLAEIAVIVNGTEPHDTLWSYHDLPEKVRSLKQAPPAALAVTEPLPPTPDTINLTDAQREVEDAFRRGWNSCRATVMQAQQPAAAVPSGEDVLGWVAQSAIASARHGDSVVLLGTKPEDGRRYAPVTLAQQPAPPTAGLAVVPEGYALVPVEPTPGMLRAGFLTGSDEFELDQPADAPGLVYRAMLAAALAERNKEGGE